jgi:hypothetical protein
MLTRRTFLRHAAGAATTAALTNDWTRVVQAAESGTRGRTPEEIAADEEYWREIQQAFTLDRSMVNLNNGGVSPSPRVVHEAYKRYLDISNQAPSYYMWQVVEPNIPSNTTSSAGFASRRTSTRRSRKSTVPPRRRSNFSPSPVSPH